MDDVWMMINIKYCLLCFLFFGSMVFLDFDALDIGKRWKIGSMVNAIFDVETHQPKP